MTTKSRIAVPRLKQTGPGSKYRYKLTYPNGYTKYVRWPEQLPKEVSNPQDKERLMQRVQQARELLRVAKLLLQ